MNLSKHIVASLILLHITMTVSWSHPGWGIVKDTKGNIYFSDVGRNIVWKIDAKGHVSRFVTGKHSHELFIGDQDNIYGVHVEYDGKNDRWLTHRWKATPSGIVSRLNPEAAKHLFEYIDSRGNTYVFSSDAHKKFAKILKVTSSEDTTHFAGGTWGDADGKGLAAQLRNFGPAAWSPDTALVFGSGGIIRKLTLDGTVSTLAGKQHGFGDPDEPRASGFLGIACDRSGAVYAAHWEKDVVILVHRDGKLDRFYNSPAGWSPVGVLISVDTVYVLEDRVGLSSLLEKAGFGGPRVQMISRNGAVTLLGTAK